MSMAVALCETYIDEATATMEVPLSQEVRDLCCAETEDHRKTKKKKKQVHMTKL